VNPAQEQAVIEVFEQDQTSKRPDYFTGNNHEVASTSLTHGILPDNTTAPQWDGNLDTFDSTDFDSIDNADGTQINWQEGSGASWGHAGGQIISNLISPEHGLSPAEDVLPLNDKCQVQVRLVIAA